MKEEKKVSIILGSNAHVPSGASESEFEYVYEKKLRPFVSNLYRYSKIQAVLHYSGVLLYWVERTHPEFFMLIEDMVSRKQTEILSGGFYEPMFPLIPLQDRIGQIELLTTYLRKHFGRRPLGCWIPCMAWEQNMTSALCASDMNYTFLSQDQFIQAGLKGEELFVPCISEDQGKLITVFPVSLSIGNELAEKSFSHVFIELKKIMDDSVFSKESRIAAVFPEKIACSTEESPDTVWNRFFEEISLSEEFAETVLPSKIMKNHKIFKKASFQNSTCDNNFSPRRFLIDTCEANGIYSKMIFTSVLIGQLRGDKARKLNAREELWKAQDSCLFSPQCIALGSPSDGLHRSELRKAAYSSLLRAEKLSREKGKFISSVIRHDFDFDGKMEFLFQDAKINCYIKLKGAGVFELDYLPKDWNYLDCGIKGGTSDTEKRIAFADVILPPQINIADLEKEYKGARLLFNEQFEALSQDRKGKSCFKLPAAGKDVPFGNIEITKCYSLKKDILTVAYNLKNTGKEDADFCFACEINFSFAGTGEEFTRFYTVDSDSKDEPADRRLYSIAVLKILDVKNEVQILLNSTNEFSGLLFPVFHDDLYQADCIMSVFSIKLESGKTWSNEFNLKFSH